MIKHLVVAKYDEKTDWLQKVINIDKIFLYDKSSGDLPNIGRESHTYLHHIVENYSILPDILILSQGWPFDHCPEFLRIIAKSDLDEMWECNKKYSPESTLRLPGFMGLGKFWTAILEENLPLDEKRLPAMRSIWKDLFTSHFPREFPNTWGAILAVAKWRLLSRSLRFYKFLLESHSNLDMLPWALEYLWPQILCKPLPRKLFL